jgi:glycerophosphoryl diester phosphodiesterase
MSQSLPQIVAHRGNAAEFPENTLESLRSAVDLGVRHLELDVQLCADQVPLLLHDVDFRRMSGRADSVFDLDWAAIARLPMSEPHRFGDRYDGVRASTLAELATELVSWPDITVFVEIKRASLRRFGTAVVLERVLACLPAVLDRCVVISFDLPCLEALRRVSPARIGWVLGACDAAERARAVNLAPEFLFCDLERMPSGNEPLWPGAWDWAIYEVRDVATARACRARGARLVETMAVRSLLAQYADPVT